MSEADPRMDDARSPAAPELIDSAQFAALSLRAIAAWQARELADPQAPPFVAGIPSLQRGAVWDAGQVELLWDSMMRGFPVGSLVLCRTLPSQSSRRHTRDSGWRGEEIGYHLLDGQQRCNAIALGFLDPLDAKLAEADLPATLWLDLADTERKAGSTRQFLFRVLSKAHPWGYKSNDSADTLGVDAIRKACAKLACAPGQRPQLKHAWPTQCELAVPLAWILHPLLLRQMRGDSLWRELARRCRQHADLPWAVSVADAIDKRSVDLAPLDQALENLRASRVIALKVQPEVLADGTVQTSGPAGDETGGIAAVEQLFQRLNSAGTVLRGEELAFSMIKAYWPRIEESFDAIRDRHQRKQQPMPGSHLASLAVRAALMNAKPDMAKLPAPLSISRIRALSSAADERDQLLNYLGIANEQAGGDDYRSAPLHGDLAQVDHWLLYRPEQDGDCGLPPVLRTSMARRTPELFLLLLYFAQCARRQALTPEQSESLRPSILGLATALCWFSDNPANAVDKLFGQRFAGRTLSPSCFQHALRDCKLGFGLRSPAQLAACVPEAQAADLQHKPRWTLRHVAVERHADAEARERDDWPFIERALKDRNLLLYAQRAFLAQRFPDYDPANADTWKQSNRPWDFDHILPSATLYYTKANASTSLFREWLNSTGNLRAWPMEENRSKADALGTIAPADLAPSLLNEDQHRAYEVARADVNQPELALRFAATARARSIRIYAEWFDRLGIDQLL
ncbi:DUF262 domain-containing protein [Rugamonas rubra]|uniref:GmrSD restriction endonucleases N-terminal domain-containing protein n=1 Tax=Rugamonas rubra TaxID=758825 RepID=A0A1I4JSL1_9BURK|nr:DUF262 domain-containing protein [Rugamonas rubra]SFL69510.1 Protein of unknown function DUF262 [Rugamonas rubra]